MRENKNRFEGKVAFVTGGGTGIGRATALAFAREGASVGVAGLTRGELDETVQLIEQSGGRALALTCDVTKNDDVKAAVARTAEAFGRLDFAFNNAGVEHPVTPGRASSTMCLRAGLPNPEEIAEAVLWLCSDAGAYVIGHALIIDGGQTV